MDPTELWHHGLDYRVVLKAAHLKFKPRTYLEVGCQHGDTLSLAECRTVGVDPRFQLTMDVAGTKPSLFLVQDTSDAFFRDYNLRSLFGNCACDMSFLDGMHLFEFLLRDFINTEKYCNPDSYIFLHDCLPIHPDMTQRDPSAPRGGRFADWWTGDVWKMVPILKRFRPDLEIRLLDAFPTGLAVVTRLDPTSGDLARHYDEIVSECTDVQIDWPGLLQLWSEAPIESAQSFIQSGAGQAAPHASRLNWQALLKVYGR